MVDLVGTGTIPVVTVGIVPSIKIIPYLPCVAGVRAENQVADLGHGGPGEVRAQAADYAALLVPYGTCGLSRRINIRTVRYLLYLIRYLGRYLPTLVNLFYVRSFISFYAWLEGAGGTFCIMYVR